ncbi:PaaX family transcriptional regulator C-terminal domain-containing protein [Amycolatopsis alkalitolerans]|uniref:PaaX family transcriptional regulator n=1 Tax=Amycolatopsis alkalitolerans TaxID=2547244 RepID=A0A5C4LVL8_9PSEU|nr:PaaX family transcriptional regulator C-terminal domain-containing protein [Amycolatopsis alkalitolerans]TNC20215.1 PaaX family transcriptional regulator [Amycolatopsis alkalitolerans]
MPGGSRPPTPQMVLMTMLGRYCLDDNPAIATNGHLSVLARIGLSEQAARLTLARMVERGLLERLRRGRLAYYRITELGLRVMRNQERRTFGESGGLPAAEDTWTILSFSLPEAQRRERHLLRRRLAWEGFGLLRDGVWIAPGDHDLTEMYEALREIGVDQQIDAFTARPKFADVQGMIARVWELGELAGRYRRFLRDWDVPDPAAAATDELGKDLLLISTWRQLLRETPRLPAGHLPPDWPAARCEELFRTLHERYAPAAAALVAEILAANQGEP